MSGNGNKHLLIMTTSVGGVGFRESWPSALAVAFLSLSVGACSAALLPWSTAAFIYLLATAQGLVSLASP